MRGGSMKKILFVILIFVCLFTLFGCFQVKTFTLSINYSGNGVVNKNPDKPFYSEGEQSTITAFSENGWEFNKWSGDASSSENPLTILFDEDKKITAEFMEQLFSINISKIGFGNVEINPNKENYKFNENIELLAIPDEGYVFSKWGGDISGDVNPKELRITNSCCIIANFIREEYPLIINIEGKGSVVKTPDRTNYKFEEEVSLSAVPEEGWLFDRWEGDITGTDNPTSLVVDEPKEVTAVFVKEKFEITLSVTGDGSITITPQKEEYGYGEVITLEAVPENGYLFDSWAEDISGTENPKIITVEGPLNIKAIFTKDEFPLIINIEGKGSVIKTPNKTDYAFEEEVNLNAVPEEGWLFDRWEGDITGTDNPTLLVVDEPKEVTAVFIKEKYEITLSVTGEGSITITPQKEEYEYGDEIKLEAVPENGYLFSNWTENISGTVNPKIITVEGPLNIKAIFAKDEYPLVINKEGEGSIIKTPNKNVYSFGEEVNLSAIPEEGWLFDRWEGDITGTDNPTSLMVDKPMEATAVFVKEKYEITLSVTGEGSITITPQKEEYEYGEIININAKPDDGWIFDSWSGNLNSNINPFSFAAEEDNKIIANFVFEGYSLNINTIGVGSVNKIPDKNKYEENEEVLLEAVSSDHYHFVQWSGDVNSNENPLILNMDSSKNINCIFEINEYPLNIEVQGTGTVIKSPDSELYEWGEKVNLEAIPSENSVFEKWEGTYNGTETTIDITMYSTRTIIAKFSKKLSEYQILIDNSHTDRSIDGLVSTVEEIGYNALECNLEQIIPVYSKQLALVIPAPNIDYSTNAINNIKNYLSNNKTLILLSDSRNDSNIYLNNLITNLNNEGIGINFEYGTIGFSGFNDNILFYITALGDYFNSGNIKALYGRNLISSSSDNRVAYASGNVPTYDDEKVKDNVGMYFDVMIADDTTFGKVIGFSSMETFNNVSGSAADLLEKMIDWEPEL